MFCWILVFDAQLVPMDTDFIDKIIFPNDTMAEKFDGVQITIPRGALIHQRQTESNKLVYVNSMVIFCPL